MSTPQAPGSVTPSSAETPITPYQHEQLRVERFKAWLTAVSIAGSIVASGFAGAIAYYSAQRVQAQTAEDMFLLKAVEVAMSGTAWEVPGRSAALKELFGERIPNEWAATFDPDSLNWGRTSKVKLMDLLATQATPEERLAILRIYRVVFPGDVFVTDSVLQAASPRQE